MPLQSTAPNSNPMTESINLQEQKKIRKRKQRITMKLEKEITFD